MLKTTWNAIPPGWTHSHLGEIWIYNEGIRSPLNNSQARRRVPLRRLLGGGQSACSSLNVIGWRHTVEYGSPESRGFYTLCSYFAIPMILFGKKLVFLKREWKTVLWKLSTMFSKKWRRWVISFKGRAGYSRVLQGGGGGIYGSFSTEDGVFRGHLGRRSGIQGFFRTEYGILRDPTERRTDIQWSCGVWMTSEFCKGM